ncbi:MAG: nickel-dependent lactate racemase, partial [Methylocella sp.]
VTLRYGRDGLDAEFPDSPLRAVYCVNQIPPIENPADAYERALERPMSVPPLSDLAKGRKSAVVVICDHTRPMHYSLLLPAILRRLEMAGVARERTNILLATGGHRAASPAEIQEMLGVEMPARYEVISHDSRTLAGHTDLGVTNEGVPVYIDKHYIESDLKIIIGLVEPHLMAGFSGGRKMVCPGVAAIETIRALHGPALLEHPNATPGVLEGNPVHLSATEAARRAGCDFAVNVTQDDQRRVTGLFAGDLEATFEAAAARVGKSGVKVTEPTDVVVTTGAGYPLDATFYQAIKGLVAVMPAVKEGGSILLAAALSEGLGSPSFCRIYGEVRDLSDFRERIVKSGHIWDDQWQVEEQAKAARKAAVLGHSDLPADTLRKAFVTYVESVESGVAHALSNYGPTATLAVVPDGPFTLLS